MWKKIKKEKYDSNQSILYRPPKVRPKYLTIGRSVFSWQNIHSNSRKKIVSEYLNSNQSSLVLAEKYSVKNRYTVLNWVNAYNMLGDDGLIRSRKNKNYSFEFKLNIVKLYLTNEVSFKELSLSQGINNFSLFHKWVYDFRKGGPDALRPKKRGRKKSLN